MKKMVRSKQANSHFDFVIRNNILPKSKRSQANMITVILIILIVIVAMIIVWNLVQPLIRRTTEGVDIGALTLDLEIDGANTQLGAPDSTVVVKRGSGKANLTGIKFVFTDGADEYIFTNDTISDMPIELETKTYSIDTSSLPGVTGVRIYPLITKAGKETVSSKYDSFGGGFSE